MASSIKYEDDLIEQIPSEINDDYSNDDLYNITSWGADMSFRELITMYDENELIKPELQRNYVWDKTEASKFIESLLMGLPVPSIFLANVGDHKLIVDGYQRIMTVYDYVKTGIFKKDNKVFKLVNSDGINEKWRGKAFSELTDADQRRIKSKTIHAIIFEQKKPENDDTSLYQVFERINTSGRTLMPQEIRNCVYQGIFNSSLINLNRNKGWRVLFGVSDPDPRMRDIEIILRFFALQDNSIKNNKSTQISLKKHLNLYMGSDASKDKNVVAAREELFKSTIKFIIDNMGLNAFHNVSTKDEKEYVERFHPTIFDAIAIATAYALKKNPNIKVENLVQRKRELLKNPNFKYYISERTTNIESINGRINLALQYLYDMSYYE